MDTKEEWFNFVFGTVWLRKGYISCLESEEEDKKAEKALLKHVDEYLFGGSKDGLSLPNTFT